MKIVRFLKADLFKSVIIALTTAFDIEFEVTDGFLAELNKELTGRKKVESPD